MISHIMIPKENISTRSSYFWPFIISGAIQYGFPTTVYRFFLSYRLFGEVLAVVRFSWRRLSGWSPITRANPKSATTTVRSSFTKQFWEFKSRWIMSMECKYSIPAAMSLHIFTRLSQVKVIVKSCKKSFTVPPDIYSVTRFNFLSLYKTPINLSTLG